MSRNPADGISRPDPPHDDPDLPAALSGILPRESRSTMKTKSPALRLAALGMCAALVWPLAAQAQNLAIVNGKAVPQARVNALLDQVKRSGQQLPPGAEQQARDQVVLREIFTQEAEKRGLAGTPNFRSQLELARQSILIRELFDDHQRKNPITDAQAKVEYDKFKAQAAGTEYRARHILVEQEDEAKALIAKIKSGAKFEDVARENSKDPGSGANGGDLDYAKADAYVPEFGKAMAALKKGEMTDAPVKSSFGWHIIRLEDTRDAEFPGFDEVKDQLKQRMEQTQMQSFQEQLRKSARTDYKFAE
jgi:peptidyl-prolyl cis-trans isomerase C